MQDLKYGTNEPIFKTETDSQSQRIGLWLPGDVGIPGLDCQEGFGVWG